MNAVAWRVFLLLIVLAPLPLGSYRPLAWSIEGVITAALMLATAARIIARRDRLFWRGALWPPLGLILLVVAWILVQAMCTVPTDIAHPLWKIAAEELHIALRPRISIAPQDGLVLLLRLLTSLGIFWLALQYGRDRDRAMELLRWLGIAAAIYALYGLLNLIAGNHYLLWYPRWAYPTDVSATFVNRNSYATYAGMGLVVLTALFAIRFQQAWRNTDVTLSWLGRRVETLAGRPMAPLLMALIVAMALLQSHSRMGLLSSLIGLFLLFGLMRLMRLIGRSAPIVVALFGITLFFLTGETVGDRLLSGETSSRPALMETADRMIASAPMLGSGYGAFPAIFPTYRDLSLPETADYIMAHNSYLETAVELGIPAALGLLLATGWMVAICAMGAFTRSRDRILPAVAFSAAVLVGIHSLLDFSIQIPAVQYTFAALLGMGVAQSFSHSARTKREGTGGTGQPDEDD